MNLYARFEIYKFPFPQFGFGIAMSYFSMLMTNNMDQTFLNKAVPYYEETAYRKYMSEVLQRIDKSIQVGNVSIFELVKLLHKNSDEIGPKSNPSRVYMDESNCDLDANDDIKDGVYENITFCQLQNLTQNQKNCCAALTKFENQLDTVLKVFSYSLQPPSYSEELADIYGIYGNLSFLGPYTNVTDVPKQETQLLGTNQNARVLMCKYLGEVDHFSPSKCKLFHRSITTEGIGYTFNNANFWNIYSDTEYNVKFASI